MKKLTSLFSLLCLTLALTVPASALEYNIDGPGDPEYGKSTSIEPVVTADRGELPNVDVSKNAALIPPTFGSPTAYTLNTGNPLTPNLAPGYMLGDGVIINGNTGVTVAPPDFNTISSGIVSGSGTNTGGTATPTPSTVHVQRKHGDPHPLHRLHGGHVRPLLQGRLSGDPENPQPECERQGVRGHKQLRPGERGGPF